MGTKATIWNNWQINEYLIGTKASFWNNWQINVLFPLNSGKYQVWQGQFHISGFQRNRLGIVGLLEVD